MIIKMLKELGRMGEQSEKLVILNKNFKNTKNQTVEEYSKWYF